MDRTDNLNVIGDAGREKDASRGCESATLSRLQELQMKEEGGQTTALGRVVSKDSGFRQSLHAEGYFEDIWVFMS